MKKILAMLLLGMLLVTPVLAEAEVSIAATSYPLYDMAKIIGGENVNVTYAPDGKIPEDAQIVLLMADEAEAPEGATVIRALDNVLAPIEGDTHSLTIPINNALCASSLTEALQTADSDNLTAYADALSAYMDAMFDLDSKIRDAVNEDMKVSCADGASMAYFAQEYEIEYAQDAEDAIALNAYEYPDDEDLETPYIDLMERNLKALQK